MCKCEGKAINSTLSPWHTHLFWFNANLFSNKFSNKNCRQNHQQSPPLFGSGTRNMKTEAIWEVMVLMVGLYGCLGRLRVIWIFWRSHASRMGLFWVLLSLSKSKGQLGSFKGSLEPLQSPPMNPEVYLCLQRSFWIFWRAFKRPKGLFESIKSLHESLKVHLSLLEAHFCLLRPIYGSHGSFLVLKGLSESFKSPLKSPMGLFSTTWVHEEPPMAFEHRP